RPLRPRRLHRRGDEAGERDAQDPRGAGAPRRAGDGAGPGLHLALGLGHRRDRSQGHAGARPRCLRAIPRSQALGRPGAAALPEADRGRGAGRLLRGPHSRGPLEPQWTELLGGRRSAAQGRGHECRPDCRAAGPVVGESPPQAGRATGLAGHDVPPSLPPPSFGHNERYHVAVVFTILVVAWVAVPLVVQFVDAVRGYDPAYYEPKDFERQDWLRRPVVPAARPGA